MVRFFDTLIARRASLDALVCSTAGLTECNAGLRDKLTGRVVRYSPRGTTPDAPVLPVARQEVRLDEESVGVVWLERFGVLDPMDTMVLERMAFAAGALWPGGGPVTLSDPALVELAVSATAQEADRARAVRLLGFSAGAEVRVLAVRADGHCTDVAEVFRSLGNSSGRLARGAMIGRNAAMITQVADNQVPPIAVPPGVRIGVSGRATLNELAESWRQASTAIRFAGVLGRGPVMLFEELGSLATLATLPRSVVDADQDVRLLRELARTPAGLRDLAVLEAYLATGSQRNAAVALHRHHSSVSRQLEALTTRYGLDLKRPTDRMRAEMAFTLNAIADS
ncbi:helix-turn-helix domain-containing protein [Frankia sp. Mgl5]|uniref:helix-turn-helix domain-containing protein n=1 Tax=Frankia sp. Mgl5 TaxID=2933793 RepID=UPI00201076FD|nr:helix-turn-helix domain-containing protein [Frankia sp. Mgl5]MCK9929800.1 helix-turn-helix domain-containing protein [Frankia sp. Mgl5]